jgi:hypothetical protein
MQKLRRRLRSNGSSVMVNLPMSCPEDLSPPPVITPACESHDERALDEALAESFPSSDPIAIAIPKPSDSPLK